MNSDGPGRHGHAQPPSGSDANRSGHGRPSGASVAANDEGEGARERLHGLDALRAHALLLGVVLHATMSFIPGELAFVTDVEPSEFLSGLWFAIHLFRMATFFLIAGFFARWMIRRRGPLEFARDRLRRIAGPLVALWLPVYVSVAAAMLYSRDEPVPPFVEWFEGIGLTSFPLMHLWFLWLLLIFYAAVLAARALVVAVDRAGRLRAAIDGATAVLVRPGAAAIVAVPLALSLYWLPDWLIWGGVPTPALLLFPNPPALVGYGSAFLLGFMIHRQPVLLGRLERWWPLNLGLGVACGLATALLGSGAVPDLSLVLTPERKALCAAIYALGFFTSTFGVTGLALRYSSAESRVHRYLAEASYWVYLVHFPLVLLFQALVAELAWPWPLKFIVVLAATLGVSLASYEWCVRDTVVGAWLAGKRRPRQKPAHELSMTL